MPQRGVAQQAAAPVAGRKEADYDFFYGDSRSPQVSRNV